MPIGAPVVDAHTHTWSPEFARDHRETMQRAWAAGLTAVVEVGVDAETSRRSLDLARADPRVAAVVGLHPHEARHLDRDWEALTALAADPRCVAIGEIGLDFYRDLSPRPEQEVALDRQLDLARAVERPVVIHSRDADRPCYDRVAAWAKRVGRYLGPDREIGMMHCYAGDVALAAAYRELGFLISVPGPVSYPGNERGRAVAREVPLTDMLVETDAPYLAPQAWRGRRNEPAYVVETVRAIADLRGTTPAEVARHTAENAGRLFAFDPDRPPSAGPREGASPR